MSTGRRDRERRPLPPGFGVIWSTVVIDLIGFGIAIPILGLYATREFGASPTQAGLLFASFSAAQFVFAPLMGRLSDRIGRKPVLLLSLFGTAVGSFVTGFAGSLWMLFAGRILDGASGASVTVAQAAVTDIAEPKDRARLLGLLGAAFGIGFSVGPAIGALAAWGSPRLPFVIAGVLALVNGIVGIRRLPETRQRAAGATARERGPLPAALTRYLVVGFAALAAFSGFEATFSLLGEARFGLTEASAAVVFLFVGVLSSVVQGGAIRPVTERFGALRTLRGGLAINAVGLLLLAGATTWPLLIGALALLVLGQGFSTPTLTALVSNRAGDARRGQALGRQQAWQSLARVGGPATAGALFQHVGIPAPYLVGAALVGLALVALLPDTEAAAALSPG